MTGSAGRSFPERFTAPDAWHMPAAYWFWHHLPDHEQIRRQVGEMHDAGILSFQVQARMAYPIEGYLDDDYLAACKVAVAEAAALGMMVGVYDDYNWQTGHAGGRAVAGHDHLRERQLFWATGVVRDGRVELGISDIHSSTESLGEPGMAWHYDGSEVLWSDWEVPFAFLHGSGSVSDVTTGAAMTEARPDGCRVVVEVDGAQEGSSVTTFVAARSTTSRLVNFLDREAADRFVTAGYDPFFRELGEYFGSTITYFFFDQPHTNFYVWAERHGNLRSPVPYHSDLPGLIRERWPENYGEVLLALLEGSSPEVKSHRSAFYDFFSKRAMSTFLGALHDWTSEKGVALSGHEVLAHVGQWDLAGAFDEWDLRINFGLDYFGIDSYRDITGVDAQDAVPQLSAKFGDSVARSNGRSGTIVEQYFANAHTGSGVYAGHWGLTLEELRAQAFRHHLFGMRQFLFHGFYQTDGFDDDPRMFSNPRFDFPPGHNFEPWFADHHGDFAIQSGRLSEFLDGAEPACDVAVLYPLRTVWAEGQGGEHSHEGGVWYENLARSGYGYHLVDEKDLLTARLEDGRLWLGERGYRALVLPGATTLLGRETIELIDRAGDAGVTVVASGNTVAAYQSGPQTAVEDWTRLVAAGDVMALVGPPEIAELEDILGTPGADAVRFGISAEASVWTWSGRVEASWRAVAFNDGTESASVRIQFPDGVGAVNRWDVATGEAARWSDESTFSVTLEPMELALFVVDGTILPLADTTGMIEWADERALDGAWTLTVPSGQHAYSDTSRSIDPSRGWEVQGLPDFSGIGIYRLELELVDPVDSRFILPAVSGSVSFRVNGLNIGRRSWSPFRFDVAADFLRHGSNTIEIIVASTAANRYYAGTGMRDTPEPAGLLATPLIRFFQTDTDLAVNGEERNFIA